MCNQPARDGSTRMDQQKQAEAQGHIDFFLSYTGHDVAWAEWMAMLIEEAGYTTFLQAWDIGPGANFVYEMNRAAHMAQRTLLVLSPAYLNSPFGFSQW